MENLLGEWMADAARFRRFGQEQLAAMVDAMAGQLRDALEQGGTTPRTVDADGPGLLDVKAAAARLGMSPSYLYRHGRTLPFARKIGARLLFDPEQLEKWIASRRMPRAA